jgi:RNA polymerase sigma-70 factor (ECF subfamily)
MPHLLRSEADQDHLLTRIRRMSRKFAIGAVDPQDVEDVVHDVAANCLLRLRSGELAEEPRNLQAYVRKLVRARIADRLESQEIMDEHDGEHLRIRRLTKPAWMSPDCEWTEEAIVAFQHDIMAKLPNRCRLAYYLVRMEGATYGEAAELLEVSRGVVHEEIKHAHRVFRKELQRLGISGQLIDLHVSSTRSAWRRNEKKLTPRYTQHVKAAAID